MQVKPERLAEHLARKGVPRCALVFGPEPLQVQESADAIRAAARAAGVTERIVFDGGTQDWGALRALAGNLSLFAERRLIEVRLGNRKPDKAGADCLLERCRDEATADVLLVTAEALDRQQQASAWAKACEQFGVVVNCRDLDPAAFRAWLEARAAARNLRLTAEAGEFLALRAEGNLLAAAQEIDKLVLLATDAGAGAAVTLDVPQMITAVTDSARYDPFQCVDAALAGDAGRTVRIVRGLREEGTEPVVIGWSLNRELRTLARVAAAQACGTPLDAAFTQQGVWTSRQGLLRRALQRHPMGRLAVFLEASIRLDQLVKGSGVGNVWDDLETLLLAVAGGPWIGRRGTAT
ncbi:MAG: DNA polymerase III subunit delta [Gammaproteobacteria bacterium]